jgi:nucleoside-diphosphate-sugar epimerase
VELQSDGTPWRPLVHAEDIARAFAAVLAAPAEVVHDQAFNVGRDEDVVQVRDIALAVSEAMSVPVTFAEGAGPDTRDYRVDFTKIGRLLPGFEPAWTIPDGIAELARDMEERGLTAEDFEGPRFVRLARIRELQAAGRMTSDLRLDHADARVPEVVS